MLAASAAAAPFTTSSLRFAQSGEGTPGPGAPGWGGRVCFGGAGGGPVHLVQWLVFVFLVFACCSGRQRVLRASPRRGHYPDTAVPLAAA